MKFRNNNKKLITVLALSTISIATIGFSAWAITEISGIDNEQVTVGFGDVTQNSLKAELTADGNTDRNLKFDCIQNSKGKITGTENLEDMEFSIKYKVTIGGDTNFAGVKYSITDSFDTICDDYVVRPYTKTAFNFTNVTASKTWYLTTASGEYTETDPGVGKYLQKHIVEHTASVVTITSTFRFQWGTKFGGLNPAVYDDTETNTDAVTNLNDFNKLYKAEIVYNKPVALVITPLTEIA